MVMIVACAIAAWVRYPRRAAIPGAVCAKTRAGTISEHLFLPVALELLSAALASGAPVPRALSVIGTCLGGTSGRELSRVGRYLETGAPWQLAWAVSSAPMLAIERLLRPAWGTGIPVTGILDHEAKRIRRRMRRERAIAAAKLGGQLLMPMTLCYLPAFILVTVVPLLIKLGSEVVGGL